jgi:MoaA/NifB/PqqE/SkfB family radical SAM enzyme
MKGMIARLGITPFPISLTYELTWLCNLSCSYCDRHTPMRHEMELDEALSALEQFRSLGMERTNLDGGEPLAHRHVREIVDWLVERRIAVVMNTNGVVVPRSVDLVRKLALVKISLDGPREHHDAMRGSGSFDKAIAGARAAQDAGVDVEFTCTVGRHNVDAVDATIALASTLAIPIVFQPALNSLFLDTDRDGSTWELDVQRLRDAFAQIERLKASREVVGNGWASLRHFRSYPEDVKPPCAAGWVFATMDPEGVLFPCGQVNRSDRSNNVVRLGARAAFDNLARAGCSQCWCARVVDANYAWGMRLDRLLPPLIVPPSNIGLKRTWNK